MKNKVYFCFVFVGGLSAPRRMSERDLPAKILREQNQDVAEGGFHHGYPLSQSRIQASKSVPSLNSDSSIGGGGIGDGRPNQGNVAETRSPAEPPASSRHPKQYPSAMSMTMPVQREPQMQQHPGASRSR